MVEFASYHPSSSRRVGFVIDSRLPALTLILYWVTVLMLIVSGVEIVTRFRTVIGFA